MEECIFCKIIKGEIPSDKVYEDEKLLCFRDINPLAPVHVLLVPKIHINSLCDVCLENSAYIARAFEKIPEITKKIGINESGFRTIINTGENGAQSVKHVHIHVLGGKQFSDKI